MIKRLALCLVLAGCNGEGEQGPRAQIQADAGLIGDGSAAAPLAVSFDDDGTSNLVCRADHAHDWGELIAIPAGFADGFDDGITVEMDPTVNDLGRANLSCNDDEITKRVAGAWECAFDAGITVESDPTVNSLAKSNLSCNDGEIPRLVGGAWGCTTDNDTTLTEAAVDAMVSNNGYALATDVAAIGSEVSGARDGFVDLNARIADLEARLGTAPYVVELLKADVNVNLNSTTIMELCSDSDGCDVVLGSRSTMRGADWLPTLRAGARCVFHLQDNPFGASGRYWSTDDACASSMGLAGAGIDNNASQDIVARIYGNTCTFADYPQTSPGVYGPDNAGFSLFYFNDVSSEDTEPDFTCVLVIRD